MPICGIVFWYATLCTCTLHISSWYVNLNSGMNIIHWYGETVFIKNQEPFGLPVYAGLYILVNYLYRCALFLVFHYASKQKISILMHFQQGLSTCQIDNCINFPFAFPLKTSLPGHSTHNKWCAPSLTHNWHLAQYKRGSRSPVIVSLPTATASRPLLEHCLLHSHCTELALWCTCTASARHSEFIRWQTTLDRCFFLLYIQQYSMPLDGLWH